MRHEEEGRATGRASGPVASSSRWRKRGARAARAAMRAGEARGAELPAEPRLQEALRPHTTALCRTFRCIPAEPTHDRPTDLRQKAALLLTAVRLLAKGTQHVAAQRAVRHNEVHHQHAASWRRGRGKAARRDVNSLRSGRRRRRQLQPMTGGASRASPNARARSMGASSGPSRPAFARRECNIVTLQAGCAAARSMDAERFNGRRCAAFAGHRASPLGCICGGRRGVDLCSGGSA